MNFNYEESGRQFYVEVEMVSVCVICIARTAKAWNTFCGIAQLFSECRASFLEH